MSGLYTAADVHGNPTTSPSSLTDRTIFISLLPKFYGGIQNNFRYKNFELDLFFQFISQKSYRLNSGLNPGSFSKFASLGNQPISVIERWRKPGDIAQSEKYSTKIHRDIYGGKVMD